MIIEDMPEADYHARPELSSTGARLLLKSPAKFHYRQSHPQASTSAFDFGTAVHTKVLGVGAGFVEYPEEHLTPSGNASTKAATLLWEMDQRTQGFTVLAPKDAAQLDAMAEAVLRNKTARALLELPGQREVSAVADVGGVASRARLDALTDETKNGRLGVDLKTTTKAADKEGFARSIIDYGYDVQDAWYTDVLRADGIDLSAFLFIVVEKEPPYLTAVYQLDVVFREMGKTKAKRARDVFAECTESGVWPGHPDDVQLVSPPTWAVIQHEEKYA